MDKYVCGYVYGPDEGVAPGTNFQDHRICPVCGAYKEEFSKEGQARAHKAFAKKKENQAMSSGRDIKRKVFALLESLDGDQGIEALLDLPLQKLIGPLFSSLCNSNPLVKWRGVTAFGLVVPRMANAAMEKARIVMRRFIWSLNDESGGIGWGAPEAMGEIMANHEKLAKEYHSILCFYIHETESGEDTFLEHALLRRGAVWGIARLAQERPQMAAMATKDLIKTLKDEDASLRGLACLALGRIRAGEAGPEMEKLIQDKSSVELFGDGKITKTTVSDLAREAFEAL